MPGELWSIAQRGGSLQGSVWRQGSRSDGPTTPIRGRPIQGHWYETLAQAHRPHRKTRIADMYIVMFLRYCISNCYNVSTPHPFHTSPIPHFTHSTLHPFHTLPIPHTRAHISLRRQRWLTVIWRNSPKQWIEPSWNSMPSRWKKSTKYWKTFG